MKCVGLVGDSSKGASFFPPSGLCMRTDKVKTDCVYSDISFPYAVSSTLYSFSMLVLAGEGSKALNTVLLILK